MGSTEAAASPRRATPQSAVPRCVIPSCSIEVEQWGDTCGNCLDDFGPYLRPTAGPGLTQRQIAERDRGVHLALALQRQVHEANRAPAAKATRSSRPA